jgi:hypothetical protein
MTEILRRVADYLKRFTPSTPTEYVAVQIARKLDDVTAVRHYLVLFEHYPEDLLVDVFKACAGDGLLSGEQFMRELRLRIH